MLGTNVYECILSLFIFPHDLRGLWAIRIYSLTQFLKCLILSCYYIAYREQNEINLMMFHIHEINESYISLCSPLLNRTQGYIGAAIKYCLIRFR